MSLPRIANILLGLCCMAALLSCQRSTDATRTTGQATHPWELSQGVSDYIHPPGGAQTARQANDDGSIHYPLQRGPEWPDHDTLDPDLLPGSWVMVGIVSDEKLALRSAADYTTLTLQESGGMHAYSYKDGELQNALDGNWSKPSPGVLRMSTTDQSGQPHSNDIYAMLFAADFLYMWSYEGHWGNWYVRQTMDEPYQVIGHNRYKSDLGEILLKNVGKNSYSGELTTPEGDTWKLQGYLVDGILSMYWGDERNNASGFAAFIVEDNWARLRGAWWKNDYEARPFSEEWRASADI